ncbi:hypothetical protein QJS04_geneDACA012611 [Acorus gramineus]|uniref:Uncharacterized protein n=1 Tax=Acorus gramineus TaxID=55184 RepID=A0AAV9B4W9_ACOGR|nr:hypothetical protein QJS04_geneDACA012611 [Acorus gramineus]
MKRAPKGPPVAVFVFPSGRPFLLRPQPPPGGDPRSHRRPRRRRPGGPRVPPHPVPQPPLAAVRGEAALQQEALRGRLASGGGGLHRAAFDCGCFGCYMSYWCRWDSSPDRELIHRVIEAFEEHLESSSLSSKKAVKSRKKDRRSIEKSGEKSKGPKEAKQRVATEDEKIGDESPVDGAGEGHCDDVRTVSAEEDNCDDREVTGNRLEVVEAPQQQRKAWPDVMGLFTSRLWGLWSPAV